MKTYSLANLANDSLDLFDPFFGDFFAFPKEAKRHDIMKTDIREDDKQFHIDIDLPRVKKENVKIELKDGYLTINAEDSVNKEETTNGKYIRRERYYGKFSRSFYVGKTLEEKDIKANLADGVLTLDINKVEPKEPEKKYIAIN